MAEIIRFPIIPRLRPDEALERLRRARAAMEASDYFARCASETRTLADAGDFDSAISHIENLISFELDVYAPAEMRRGQGELATYLVEYLIDARGAKRRATEHGEPIHSASIPHHN